MLSVSVEVVRVHIGLEQFTLYELLLAQLLVSHHVALLAERPRAESAFEQLHALVHQQVALQVASLAEDFVAAADAAPVLGVKFLAVGVYHADLLVPVLGDLRECFVDLSRITTNWHRLLELSCAFLFTACSPLGNASCLFGEDPVHDLKVSLFEGHVLLLHQEVVVRLLKNQVVEENEVNLDVSLTSCLLGAILRSHTAVLLQGG